MAAKILIINEISNYFMLTLLKDRGIKGCFMIKDRVITGCFVIKDRVIKTCFMIKDRVIVAVCSSSPKWTQKMIINYLYF